MKRPLLTFMMSILFLLLMLFSPSSHNYHELISSSKLGQSVYHTRQFPLVDCFLFCLQPPLNPLKAATETNGPADMDLMSLGNLNFSLPQTVSMASPMAAASFPSPLPAPTFQPQPAVFPPSLASVAPTLPVLSSPPTVLANPVPVQPDPLAVLDTLFVARENLQPCASIVCCTCCCPCNQVVVSIFLFSCSTSTCSDEQKWFDSFAMFYKGCQALDKPVWACSYECLSYYYCTRLTLPRMFRLST